MDRLDGVRAKLKRAEQHIDDVDRSLQAFFSSHPYKVATKRDPETRRVVYFLESVEEVPASITATVGDAIQNLRSALDHLAYQLVCTGTGDDGPFFHVYFPICGSASEYESKKMGYIQGASTAAIEALDAIRPYKGGTDSLWQLNRLSIIDKHRLLLTISSRYHSLNLGGHLSRDLKRRFPDFGDVPDFSLFFPPRDFVRPLKAGDKLFIDAPGAEVDEHLQFRFVVALGEPGVVDGEPVLPFLKQLLELVSNLIPPFAPLLAVRS